MDKPPGVSRPDIDHVKPIRRQPGLFQKIPGISHAAPGKKIARNKMTTALFAAGHKDSVRAVLKRSHEIFHLQLAGARGADDPDIRRVLKPGGT
jgi:hypothetical protein